MIEVFADVKAKVEDPTLKWIEGWPGQGSQPHQEAAIGKAAELVRNISAVPA
jgi:hypothetical protein